MEDKLKDQKEIIDHYMHANKDFKSKDTSEMPNEEFKAMIRQKEQEIAKFDQMMKQQSDDRAGGFNPNFAPEAKFVS